MSELEVSGERMIEDAYLQSLDAYVIYIMHTAAYAFAHPFCAGKVVLDLGCGSGYGSNRIAEDAVHVHGVDIDAGAVEFACERYSRPNLAFSQVRPGAGLPFADASFEVVLSFQVLEHVPDAGRYLAEARRVTRPGGLMIVVTPDKAHRLLPGQRPWNRWHVREYSRAQLEREIRPYFHIESSLRMGAEWNVAGVEIRRYRKTKWLTLPLTLPFMPERVRRAGLNLLHGLRKRPSNVSARQREVASDFGFDETAMRIEADPPNPLNLVLVGRRRDANPS